MTALYIDTSNFLSLGLLDIEENWLEYKQTENLKSSSILHHTLYEMLEKHDLRFKDVENIFLSSGPGSYTGIRLSEGLAQVMEWQKFRVFSFYHFEVPKMLGYDKGTWFCQAFKGEVFFYRWDEDKTEHGLFKKEELEEKITENSFSHYEGLLEGSYQYTAKLIHENPKRFFSLLKSKEERKEPFYFRALEKEFSIPGKAI